MKKGILIAALITAGTWNSAGVNATELVYEPINPSFGGNPLNGSFLLSKANSQNAHSAPYNERSYDERLQESLERAYINRIVREITDIAFGEQEYDEDGNPHKVPKNLLPVELPRINNFTLLYSNNFVTQ